MKLRLTSKLGTLAAAIGLALGTSSVLAQDVQPEPSTQQPGQTQTEDTFDRSDDQGFGQSDDQGISQSDDQDFGQSDDQGFGQSDDSQAAAGEQEIDKLAEENADLSKFVDALKTTGLADELTGGTEYTVFAPTNEALDSTGEPVEEMEHEALVALLRAHIVADDVDMELARTLPAAQTVDGGTVQLQAPAEGEDGELMVGDATAIESDIELGNLRVYAIDGVLESNPSAGQEQGETDSGFGDPSQDETDTGFGDPSQDETDTGFGDPSQDETDTGLGDPSQDDDLGAPPEDDFGRSSPDDIR